MFFPLYFLLSIFYYLTKNMFGFGKKEVQQVSPNGIAVLFDIGGTKMRVAISRDGYTFEEPHIGRTPDTFLDGIKLFEDLVTGALGHEKAAIVAGGIAGTLLTDHSAVFHSPNLPTWNGKPLSANLFRVFSGAPVVIENDAGVVGLGEAVSGAGQGERIVMYVTVSTGVGGARIVNGVLDPSAIGFEPGRQVLAMDTGTTLESLVSGVAIEQRFGIKPYDLADMAKREQVSDELAYGLANSILHWSPDVVVLGGSIIVGPHNTLPLERIEKKLRELLPHLPQIPKLKKATLGDLGGLHGAMALVRQAQNTV